jgi:hypothetical protein
VKRDVERAEAEHVRERSANAMAGRRSSARNVPHGRREFERAHGPISWAEASSSSVNPRRVARASRRRVGRGRETRAELRAAVYGCEQRAMQRAGSGARRGERCWLSTAHARRRESVGGPGRGLSRPRSRRACARSIVCACIYPRRLGRAQRLPVSTANPTPPPPPSTSGSAFLFYSRAPRLLAQ